MNLLYASTRQPVALGPELGRGGEGAVYALEGRADDVAKLYLAAPDTRKAEKLRAMASARFAPLASVAAWPKDLLVDATGRPHGFVMRRVKSHWDAHQLYSPKSRSHAFPEADFRFLVHVGTNISRAFALAHGHGTVIGDVNHGNVMVGADGTVILIDCDSFQIAADTSVFPCDVGVPLFTAPELQGQTLRGRLRSPDHDRFGLAVLLFHLLFMGRHPFAGRYLGRGDMPIERAIAEHRFAYGGDAWTQMQPPPATVPLATAGPSAAALFREAFSPSAPSRGRPSAPTWIDALTELKEHLKPCGKVAWHHHADSLQHCPWCEVESSTGVRLFGQRLVWAADTAGMDVESLWKAILAAPRPPTEPVLPSAKGWQAPPGIDLYAGKPSKIRQSLCSTVPPVAILIGFIGCMASSPPALLCGLVVAGIAFALAPRGFHQVVSSAEESVRAARSRWEQALQQWRGETSRAEFDTKLAALTRCKSELDQLPRELERKIERLRSEMRDKQLARYLDRFRIDRASIRGIGTSRAAMLAAYGIETAADVERYAVMNVPGFGEKLTGELLAWRHSHSVNFRFNPNEPLDPRDIAQAKQEIDARRTQLISTLRGGPPELQRAAQRVTEAQTRLLPVLERLWSEFQLAEARVQALKS